MNGFSVMGKRLKVEIKKGDEVLDGTNLGGIPGGNIRASV